MTSAPDSSAPDSFAPTGSEAVVWYRRRRPLAALCVLLVLVAATLVVVGLRGQHHAPRPDARQAIPLSSGSNRSSTSAVHSSNAARTTASTTRVSSQAPSLGTGSQPIHITIASIGVQSNLLLLGLNNDRTIEVPPLTNVGEAGWYEYSPTPGAIGPAVILGHIDSAVAGKGVFYDLGRVRQNDQVVVTRADHRTATFTVTRIIEVAKTAFPTQEVYGNTAGSELRLITCGGRFDSRARSYLDNIIVFGRLVSLVP